MSNINPLAPQSPESTNSQGSPDNGNLQSRTVTTTPVRRTSDRLRAVRARQQALLSGITQQSIQPSPSTAPSSLLPAPIAESAPTPMQSRSVIPAPAKAVKAKKKPLRDRSVKPQTYNSSVNANPVNNTTMVVVFKWKDAFLCLLREYLQAFLPDIECEQPGGWTKNKSEDDEGPGASKGYVIWNDRNGVLKLVQVDKLKDAWKKAKPRAAFISANNEPSLFQKVFLSLLTAPPTGPQYNIVGVLDSHSTITNRLEAILINDYRLRIPHNYPTDNSGLPTQMEIEAGVPQVQDDKQAITTHATLPNNQQTPQTNNLQEPETVNQIEKSIQEKEKEPVSQLDNMKIEKSMQEKEKEPVSQLDKMKIDSLINGSDLGSGKEEEEEVSKTSPIGVVLSNEDEPEPKEEEGKGVKTKRNLSDVKGLEFKKVRPHRAKTTTKK